MTFVFAGTSLDDLRAFPDDARRRAGYQLQRLRDGYAANDWHLIPAMGEGAGELRIDLVHGVRRRVFAQVRGDVLVVIHGFQERPGPAAAADATLARRRMANLDPGRLRHWEDIWEAIEGTREKAANVRLRAELLNEVQAMLEMQDRSEPQLAKLLAIPEDRVAEVQRGMIDRCDLDGLVHMLASAGYGIDIRLRPPGRSR